jgi:hypothetical protein
MSLEVDMFKKILILMIFVLNVFNVFSQTEDKWYSGFPQKAEWLENNVLMKIKDKTYHVYNAFDPIAPKGGERIIDFSGVLNYYMWLFNTKNGFKVARIDMKLNIFYYDEETNVFVSPSGEILHE